MRELYIGVMSGTSMDGVDIALVAFDDNNSQHFSVVAQKTYPITALSKNYDSLASFVLADRKNKIDLMEFAFIDSCLGDFYSDCINNFLDSDGINKDKIIAIGLHGQTVLHKTDSIPPVSLQIGNPNIVANRTSITTVADFRRADIACGGQGAPLTPAFHKLIFAQDERNVAVLNIGGIANLTLLFGCTEIMGFDTGPGNCALDAWIRDRKGEDFDQGGRWAATANYDDLLLERLRKHSFFHSMAPKSACTSFFDLHWIKSSLRSIDYNIDDNVVQSTLLELTAREIASSLAKYMPKFDEILVCGGGDKNKVLCHRIWELAGKKNLYSTADKGVHPKYLEAVAFAWFARERIHKHFLPLSYTGSGSRGVICGAVYEASTH